MAIVELVVAMRFLQYASLQGKLSAQKRYLLQGNWDVSNVHTVSSTVSARYGGKVVHLKPAPAGAGIDGPGICQKMLKIADFKDCVPVVKGNKLKDINLALPMKAALKNLND